jgi:hypothetical protein
MYDITIDFSQKIQFEQNGQKFLNMAKPFNIKKDNTVKTKSVETELQLIYDHILNIWCSKNEALYEWIMNFIACTLGGRKLRKAIYSQCTERCGRGTIINFLASILGDAICKTSSIETVCSYTKPMEGCALVNLDEMPVDNGNYKSIGDRCKSLITEPTFDCREMYRTGYTQKNTFNVITTTNNDAINFSLSNNERYVVTDIDESMKGNVPYFTKLNKATNNVNVQHAFYNEMMKRFKTLDNWNEDIIPESKTKQQKIADALPRLYKHLKEEYILRGKNFNYKTKDFFIDYKEETKDNTSKEKLGRMLTKIDIKPIKVNKNKSQYYVYNISHVDLKQIYDKHKWITDDDLFEYEDGDNKPDTIDDKDAQIKTLQKEILKLQSLIDCDAQEKKKIKKSKKVKVKKVKSSTKADDDDDDDDLIVSMF